MLTTIFLFSLQERDVAGVVAPFGGRSQSARGYLRSQLHSACRDLATGRFVRYISRFVSPFTLNWN